MSRRQTALALLTLALGVLSLAAACADDDEDGADESPADVVEAFLEDADASAPPGADGAALNRAGDRLTARSRDRAQDPAGLARFLGVQDLPDEGVTIEETEEDGDLAVVRARLQYSGGDTVREFHLQRDQDRWRIDWVNAMPLTADSSPEEVVAAFLGHVFASAPPDGPERPAVVAASLLTDEAREAIDESAVLSGQLALLLGIQDVPDQGYQVGDAAVDGDDATVEATLSYSGGPATRTFALVQTDDGWHIDAISE